MLLTFVVVQRLIVDAVDRRNRSRRREIEQAGSALVGAAPKGA